MSLLDLLSLNVPTEDAQSAVVARYMALMSLVVFRFGQLSTRSYDNVLEYKTLKNYRKRASERLTFERSVLKQIGSIQKQWIPESRRDTATQTPTATARGVRGVSSSSASSAPHTRARRCVEDVACGSDKTTATPKKRSATLYEKADSKLSSPERRVRQRTQNCPGKPFRTVSDGALTNPNISDKAKGGRAPCWVCGALTPWYCLECHHRLCMEPSANFIKKEGLAGNLVPLARVQYNDGTTVLGRKACWIQHHQPAYENEIMEEDEEAVARQDLLNG